MKPYGREKKVRFQHKKDRHPKKGFINWWEDLCNCLSRKTMKQLLRRKIDNEEDI